MEATGDKQFLDQLVQELFLEHLRRELGAQKKNIDDSKDILFNLDRKFIAEFKKLIRPLDAISDTLDKQTLEINDVKGDINQHYGTLLKNQEQNKTDIASLSDMNCSHYKKQDELLGHIQEYLSQQSTKLIMQITALTSITNEQFSITNAKIDAQNVTLISLIEQNVLQHQQLLTTDEKHHTELILNRRWGKLAVGFSLINTLILAGIATMFIIKHGV